ncbi:MAG: ABC transporter permease, partial [Burkholderiaceae bacterium]|nr:ABC transporter permease [Burkholderiaceae bacterium]
MSARLHIPLRQRLLRNPRVVLGGFICAFLVLVSLLAPWIAPLDPQEQDLIASFEPPALMNTAQPAIEGEAKHWLGTDNLGRDVLSRLVYGARIALWVALASAVLSCAIGSTLGALAGYFGGKCDALISRMVDVWMSFPPVLLAVVLVSVIGTGLWSVIAAIVIVDWTRFCRVVRAETQAQKALDYVTSARMLG